MMPYYPISTIKKIAEKLSEEFQQSILTRKTINFEILPSLSELELLLRKLKQIIFPGYLTEIKLHNHFLKSFYETEIQSIYAILSEQIFKGFVYNDPLFEAQSMAYYTKQAQQAAHAFLDKLPILKNLLDKDVIAAYNGDPAAKSYGEVIYCYPVITSLIHHRVAHELYKLNIPLIPRIISEMAHSQTGIDIHPGAQIGEFFTIDHGTGVVIGETTIIGNNVKLYQGVTLGAKYFPLDQDGQPIKGIPRHPIVEDDVIIYANATILGRVRIGRGAIIGANVWITTDIEPNAKIYIRSKQSL